MLTSRQDTRRKASSLLMVHPLTAQSMPDLGVPTMNDAARRTFLNIIRAEDITSDNFLEDILQLAAARGYAAHPADWVPQPSDYPSYPALYQPWAIWLAENGHAPFSAGVPITPDNFRRFRKDARRHAFRRLYERDRTAAYDLLRRIGGKAPTEDCLDLLRELGGGASFDGGYPTDLPVLKHFLNHKSEKLRQFCRERIQLMYGFETVEAHAKYIARHFEIRGNRIVPSRPEPLIFSLSQSLYQSFRTTTIEALAAEFKLRPAELPVMWDDERTASDLEHLVVGGDDVEARTVLAQRFLEKGKQCVPHLLRGCAKALWQQAIRLQLRSEYMWSVKDYVGHGVIDVTTMRELLAYERLEETIRTERETGELPVNHQHDPVRILGFLLDTNAAREVLGQAIAFGMGEDNPRLNMLKLNLEL